MVAVVAMIIWRITLPSMMKALLWVFGLVGGVVVLAVSVEKANEDWPVLFRAVRFQLVFILIWLSPLLVALAVGLAGVHRRSSGEQQALFCSGVGPNQLAPVAGFVGLFVAVLGFAASEWLVPIIAVWDSPAWMWTAQGPVRVLDGLLVPLDLTQPVHSVASGHIEYVHPRVASLVAVLSGTDLTSITEQYSRLSRPLACVGFSLMGLYFGQVRQPIVWIASLGGVFIIFDIIAWSLGAQGQLNPIFAGSVLAWLWCVPVFWMTRQPST